MDFLKIRKFRKARKPKLEMDLEEKPVPQPEELNDVNVDVNGKTVAVDSCADVDDDDDDFITNEVKRRLKELRRNSFMGLIPEEEGGEEGKEEEGKTSSSEGRDTGSHVEHMYCDFESIYETYCERMLFFDRISAQQLNEAGTRSPSTPSPRGASRKLASSLRCLSLKKIEEPDSETEQLHQPDDSPYQDLETAYVAHVCLTWEALHSQYIQLSQKISCQPENPTCYNHCAQQYQQFQVLLQRFIENEPFEQGTRMEKYARSRNILSKLLQVPNVRGTHPDMVEDKDYDYRKSLKLKELRKKKGLKKKSWPGPHDEVDLLFSVIDAKVVSRVLRMARITKDQLLWCEDKIRKVDLTDGRLRRDPSPILFPC